MLFISPRNPFSGRFSGDVIRAKKFTKFFEDKFHTTVISLDKLNSKKKIGKIKIITFKEENIFLKLKYIFGSFVKLKPFQLGYFYSNKMHKYVINNHKKFDIVFCQSIRTAQFVIPLNFKKKILDMGDLYSSNYYQIFKNSNFFNPMKYIYLIESFLIKKYELLCLNSFQKTLLFSEKDIKSLNKIKNTIVKINFGIEKISNNFRYKKKNNRIIFIGNINYLPNKLACRYFIKKILPKILKTNPDIEFHIIGEISGFNKFFWSRNKSIKVHGKVSNLAPVLTKSFCALANLNISPGPNTKILTYMSYGIPCIASKTVMNNFHTNSPNLVQVYKNDNELIKLIFKLKNNRKLSENISKKSLIYIKKFKWENVLKKLKKL